MSDCAKPKCKQPASQAFDVWSANREERAARREGGVRHYEVCDKHAAEYWPFSVPGFVRSDHAERIAKDLVPAQEPQ